MPATDGMNSAAMPMVEKIAPNCVPDQWRFWNQYAPIVSSHAPQMKNCRKFITIRRSFRLIASPGGVSRGRLCHAAADGKHGMAQAMDGRQWVSFPAPCMTPSIAADRAGKARMFEHGEVRVRAGARAARSAGKFRQHDVAETVMPARNGFGDFCRNKSRTLAAASGTRQILRKKSLDYKVRPWTLSFGLTFGRSVVRDEFVRSASG